MASTFSVPSVATLRDMVPTLRITTLRKLVPIVGEESGEGEGDIVHADKRIISDWILQGDGRELKRVFKRAAEQGIVDFGMAATVTKPAKPVKDQGQTAKSAPRKALENAVTGAIKRGEAVAVEAVERRFVRGDFVSTLEGRKRIHGQVLSQRKSTVRVQFEDGVFEVEAADLRDEPAPIVTPTPSPRPRRAAKSESVAEAKPSRAAKAKARATAEDGVKRAVQSRRDRRVAKPAEQMTDAELVAELQEPAVKAGVIVTWKAAGKVARLEGSAGKRVYGRVLEVKGDDLTVRPFHRNFEDSDPMSLGMDASVPAASVQVMDVKPKFVAAARDEIIAGRKRGNPVERAQRVIDRALVLARGTSK